MVQHSRLDPAVSDPAVSFWYIGQAYILLKFLDGYVEVMRSE
jgi:hypothetical protein